MKIKEFIEKYCQKCYYEDNYGNCEPYYYEPEINGHVYEIYLRDCQYAIINNDNLILDIGYDDDHLDNSFLKEIGEIPDEYSTIL